MQYIATVEKKHEVGRMGQKDRMDYLLRRSLIPVVVYDQLDLLRILGNKAVHDVGFGTLKEADAALFVAYKLAVWLVRECGKQKFNEPRFNSPLNVNIESSKSERNKGSGIKTLSKAASNYGSVVSFFYNNELEYEKWLQDNKTGYVFNHFGVGIAVKI